MFFYLSLIYNLLYNETKSRKSRKSQESWKSWRSWNSWSRESHEVIAVGRGRGKSHENNEDTDSVQGDHASFFSEIILQDQCEKECKKNQGEFQFEMNRKKG